MKCPYCSELLEDKATVCLSCGKGIKIIDSSTILEVAQGILETFIMPLLNPHKGILHTLPEVASKGSKLGILIAAKVLPDRQVSWTYTDGTRYEGSVRRYEGSVMNEKWHGVGKLINTDGDRYEGIFKDGLPHGKGILTLSDGKQYEYEYREGKFYAQGVANVMLQEAKEAVRRSLEWDFSLYLLPGEKEQIIESISQIITDFLVRKNERPVGDQMARIAHTFLEQSLMIRNVIQDFIHY